MLPGLSAAGRNHMHNTAAAFAGFACGQDSCPHKWEVLDRESGPGNSKILAEKQKLMSSRP